MRRLIAVISVSAVLSIGAAAQMEKRDTELYERELFLKAVPAVRTLAPDLTLVDIDGRPWTLSEMRKKTVVIIKGGYT